MSKQIIDCDPNQAGLFRWIKQQQEEKAKHQLAMAHRNYEQDRECYLKHLAELVAEWRHIKIKEKQIIMSLVNHHKAHRNLSPGQRSLIIGLYMKYCLKA